MVMVTATSTRSTVMYTPCSVAGRVSIATGPVVEEHLAATTAAVVCGGGDGDGGSVVVVVVIVVVVVVVDVSVDVAVLHIHLLFAVC